MMVCWSAIAHLIFYSFLLLFHFPAYPKEAPVYYVDLLNLPVASPQAGSPGEPQGAPAPPGPAPPQPAAPKPRQMTLPSKQPERAPTRQAETIAAKRPDAAQAARELDERIARLERDAAARHADAAMEAMRKRGVGAGRVGMPGATGTEAGSDYASYIQSRLKDAFVTTIAFQGKNPEVAVRITIGKTGRISKVRLERSTGDKVFEAAVFRAIAKAEQSFPPPPKGEEFENGFVFRPQGVGKN